MLEVEDKKEQEEPDGLLLVSFVMVWPEQDMENLKMESFLVGRSYYTPLGLGLRLGLEWPADFETSLGTLCCAALYCVHLQGGSYNWSPHPK